MPLLLAGCLEPGYVDWPLDLYRGDTCAPRTLQVEPLYPASGRDWNDYVAVADPVAGLFDQRDQACAGSEAHFTHCAHAGELRQVALPACGACDAGWVMRDSQNAFAWRCQVREGRARFVSTGFRPGKGLGDLVDAAGWVPLRVELRRGGQLVARSEPGAWWGNPVRAISAAQVDAAGWARLSEPGTVYTLGHEAPAVSSLLAADRVALVTLTGVEARAAPGLPATLLTSGQPCLVVVQGDPRFVWIEGAFDGADLAGGVLLDQARFARVHRVRARGARTGLYVYSARAPQVSDSAFTGGASYASCVDAAEGAGSLQTGGGLFRDLRISGCGGHGVHYQPYRADTTFYRVTAVHNGQEGMRINEQHIAVIDSVVAGNGGDGLFFNRARGRALGLLAFANARHGLSFDGSGAVVQGLAAIANGEIGLRFDAVTAWLARIVLAGNALGFDQGSPLSSVAEHMVVAHNDVGLLLPDAAMGSPVALSGRVALGNNGVDCAQQDQGEISCGLVQSASVELLRGPEVDLRASFAGAVAADRLNATPGAASGGATLADGVADWTTFEHWLRAWGREAAGLDDPGLRGPCAAGLCQIWDWRLAPGAELLAGVAGTFAAGAPCPASVHGDAVRDTGSDVYLVHAQEIVADWVGDEDGLCESDERCVFTPNIGADQSPATSGEDEDEDEDEDETCAFQDGAVKGVRMVRR